MPADGRENGGGNGREAGGMHPTPRSRPPSLVGGWANVRVKLRTLNDLDRRTRAAQDAFALRDALADDLGGWNHLSAAKRELVESAAVLGAVVKDASASYLGGRPVDLTELMALMNVQRRLLTTLGLERQARNITPLASLNEQLLAGRGARIADDDE